LVIENSANQAPSAVPVEHAPASAVGLEAAGAVPGPPVEQTARSEQSTVLKSRSYDS